MPIPDRQRVPLVAGDSLRLRYELVDEEDGRPFDLTGCDDASWSLCAYPPPRGTNPAGLLSKSLGAGIAVVDAPGGVLEVSLTRDETAALQPGAYLTRLSTYSGTTERQSGAPGHLIDIQGAPL